LIVLASCSAGETKRVTLSTPLTTAPIDSVVMVVETPGETTRVFAHVFPLDDVALRVQAEGGPTTVTLMYSPLDLADLGLIDGEIPLASKGRPSRLLPEVDEIYAATVVDGVTNPFERVRENRLNKLEIENPLADRCGDMVHTPIVLPFVAGRPPVIRFVLPLADESLLVATSSGAFLRVRDFDVEPLDAIPIDTPRDMGWRTSDGSIWLLGDGGRVARLRADLSVEQVPTGTVGPGRVTDYDGPSDLPLELFATGDGLWRFHDGAWERVLETPYSIFRQVLYVGRGEALIGWPSAVLRYRQGGRTVENLTDELSEVGPLVRSSGHNYAAIRVGESPQIYRSDRGGWERVMSVQLVGLNSLLALAATEEGFIFGGGSGYMGQVIRGAGLCPPTRAPRPPKFGAYWGVARIVPLSPTRFVLIAHEIDGLTPSGTVIGSGLIRMELRSASF